MTDQPRSAGHTLHGTTGLVSQPETATPPMVVFASVNGHAQARIGFAASPQASTCRPAR